MVYEYVCPICNYRDEIIKGLEEFERQEVCPICKEKMVRLISLTHIDNSSLETPYFSSSLGKRVSTRKEEVYEAKRLGFEEVGNEDQGKHIKPPVSDWESV